MAKRNSSLTAARKAKNDEFYTQLADIESEINEHYTHHFKDKVVLCNCDDPESSKFFEFFTMYFHKPLGLKKIIATHYNKDGSPSYKLEWCGETLNGKMVNLIKTPLIGNGDFRSDECIALLKEADIVCTNPPFSLFRQFVATLIEHEKDFIIIGSKNAITYTDFFPLLKDNKVWVGHNNVKEFLTPDGTIQKFGNIGWYTNLDIAKRHEKLPLNEYYYGNENNYPTYDNYNAINVATLAEIPHDYYGIMGVPITFMDKYCPEQFEIVGCPDANVLPAGWRGASKSFVEEYYKQGKTGQYREGNRLACFFDKNNEAIVPFKRVLIRRKETTENDS